MFRKPLLLAALAAALIVTLVSAARLEIGDNDAEGLFYVQIAPDGSVEWRTDDGAGAMVEYATLSSIDCTLDGHTPMLQADGTWRCLQTDRLETVCASMSPLAAPWYNLVAKTDGAGGWTCGRDDYSAPACVDTAQVLKLNAATWQCADENDIAYDLNCAANQYYVYTRGTGWACADALPADADTAAALLATCAPNEAIKANSTGGFECSVDFDFLTNDAGCTVDGDLVKSQGPGNATTCAADDDAFAAFTCPASHPWPKYDPTQSGTDADDYWVCSDTFGAGGTTSTGSTLAARRRKRDTHVGMPNTLLLWGAVAPQTSALAAGDALDVHYAGGSVAPWVVPSAGRVVALSVRVKFPGGTPSGVDDSSDVLSLTLLVDDVAAHTTAYKVAGPSAAEGAPWYTSWFDGSNFTSPHKFAAMSSLGVAVTSAAAFQETPSVEVQLYVSLNSIDGDAAAVFDCFSGAYITPTFVSTVTPRSDSLSRAQCDEVCTNAYKCAWYQYNASSGECTYLPEFNNMGNKPSQETSGVTGFRGVARGRYDGAWNTHTALLYFDLSSGDASQSRTTSSASRQARECANIAELLDAGAFYTDSSQGTACTVWPFVDDADMATCFRRHLDDGAM